MASLHNEYVKRDRTSYIIVVFLILIAFVTIATVNRGLKLTGKYQFIIDGILVLLFILLTYKIHLSSKTSLKYSMISDELLVHKIVNDDVELLERISLQSIRNLTKISKISDRVKSVKDDVTCPLRYNVYKLNHDKGELYFRPSEKMVRKIRRVIEERNRLVEK